MRIDKWLWAARFFRTRGLAQDAIDNGRVLVGDEVLCELTPYDLTKGRITYRFMPGRGGPGQYG